MKRFKRFIAAGLVCLGVTTTNFKAEAGGIPVVDSIGVSLESLILTEDTINTIETIAMALDMAAELELFMAYYEKWEAVVDHLNFDALMEDYCSIPEPYTAEMVEPVFEAEDVWGDRESPSRVSFEKRLSFVHGKIGKLNELHEKLNERNEKIKDTVSDIDTVTHDKAMFQKQVLLLAENTAAINEQSQILLIQTEIQLGLKALELEELARGQKANEEEEGEEENATDTVLEFFSGD